MGSRLAMLEMLQLDRVCGLTLPRRRLSMDFEISEESLLQQQLAP